MCFVGFEMFVVVVEQDMAGGDGFVGAIVVFDVVGAEPRVSIVNVHVTVGGGDFAARLRFRDQIDIAALAGGQPELLSKGNMRRRAAEQIKKRREEEKGAKRGGSPCTGVRITRSMWAMETVG